MIIVLLKVFSTALSLICGAPSVSSPTKTIDQALKLAKLKPKEKFYDLGSNTGKVLKIAARNFGVIATGLEISPLPYLISKLNCAKLKNIEIKMQDIFSMNISQADVIYCYLLPRLMKKLAIKFQNELKPGTRVISVSFPLINKKPDKVVKINKYTIYLYQY